MVGNANALIGMRKEPAEIGFFAKSESVLEMERKRVVDFLFAAYCLLAENYGWRDDMARTNVKSQADGGSGNG